MPAPNAAVPMAVAPKAVALPKANTAAISSTTRPVWTFAPTQSVDPTVWTYLSTPTLTSRPSQTVVKNGPDLTIYETVWVTTTA